LKEINPRRAQQIEQLEEKDSALDKSAQKAESDYQLIRQSLDAEKQPGRLRLEP
jgi:hypothetical protein